MPTIVRWTVLHSDGHEHQPNLKPTTDLVALVLARNNEVRSKISELDPSDIESKLKLESQIKHVKKYTKTYNETVSFHYQGVYLNVSLEEYQYLLRDRYILLYWFEKLFLFPKTKMFDTLIDGENIFIVDNDWLNEHKIPDAKETVDLYEC